jgi:hypothetical protein
LFETVEQFIYLGTTLTNQNNIYEEIKSRLKLLNACYHSVLNLLSSGLPEVGVKLGLTLREECRLRMFENRVLRRIFGPKRHKELYARYFSPNIVWVTKSRIKRWAGYVARMGDRRDACRGLVERPERRRPLGRPKSRWEDNIKMDLPEVGWGGMDYIDLV